MFMMINPVREYAWGSTTAFSELFGWADSETPRAEIWMGAHPGDPSSVQLGTGSAQQPVEVTSLPEYLQASALAPEDFPFLLKVLAAEQPLSIQSHPTRDRARRGFAAEERAGIALDAPHRSYKDPNAKPELVVALTQFTALCGFRLHAAAAADLRSLSAAISGSVGPAGAAQLQAVLDQLCDFVSAQDYRGALEHLLRSERDAAETAARQLHQLLEDAARPDQDGGSEVGAALDAHTRQMLHHVSTAFPADPGIFVTLLLNRVTLQPGESIYLPAGNLHAYLHGVGVELMGNSDNVLRGGLTSKHLAVDELLSVTDCEVLPVPHCSVQETGSLPLRSRYAAPFHEFQLERIQFPGEVVLEQHGHGIILCTSGQLRLHAPAGAHEEAPAGETPESVHAGGHTSVPGTPRMLTLNPGESAFLPETAGHLLSASAQAEAFVASSAFTSQDQEHPHP